MQNTVTNFTERHVHQTTPALSMALLLELLQAQRFGVEYQPIVALDSGAILAFEALARFYSPEGLAIPPQQVFDALHASPITLYQTELAMKRLQLQHAPSSPLFVNLDPDAYAVLAGEATSPLLDLLGERRELVVEIIENSDISDAYLSQQMARACSDRDIGLALDDIGAPNSMMSIDVMLAVDWFKLDKSWLQRAKASHAHAALKLLVDFAHASGCKVILEGIEQAEDLSLARQIGVDCVQGFLYRPAFQYFIPSR